MLECSLSKQLHLTNLAHWRHPESRKSNLEPLSSRVFFSALDIQLNKNTQHDKLQKYRSIFFSSLS